MRITPRKDKWLRGSYDIFNDKYYDNKLPEDIKVFYGTPVDSDDAHWDPVKREIVVNKDLRTHDSLALICLLHEMAHVKMDEECYIGGTTLKDPHHGMRYQAEIDRLYKVGAYDGLL